MDAREEMARLIAWMVQNVDELESSQIKADIALLLGAVGRLTTVLADRNTAQAKQRQSRKAKPPKYSPQKAAKQQRNTQQSADSSDNDKGAEDRSKALSAIQQGIRQADSSLEDEQRALRQQIYGKQNDEVAFQKAAQAIAS